VALALLLFLIFLPQILSTVGRPLVSHHLGNRLGGKVHIDDLDLRWGEGQTIEGFTWTDGRTQLRIDAIETELSLFSLFWGSRQMGISSISGWLLLLEQPPLIPIGAVSTKPLPVSLALQIEPGKIVATTPSGFITLLDNVKGELRISRDRCHFVGHLAATSDNGTIALDLYQSRPGPLAVDLKGEKVPSQLLEPLLPRWSLLVGPTFDIDLVYSRSKAKLSVSGTDFDLEIDGAIEEGLFSLNEPAKLDAVITPELVRQNPFPPPKFEPPALAAPTELSLLVKQLSFPIGPWKESADAATIACQLTTSSILLVDNLLGSWSTPAFKGRIVREKSSKPYEVACGFDFVTVFSQGSFEMGALIDRLWEGRLAIDIEQIPSLWLVTLIPPMRTPAPFLGSLIDCQVTFHGSWEEGAGILSAASDAFVLDRVPFSFRSGVLIDQQLSFAYTLPRIVQAYYLEPAFGEIIIDRVDPISVTLDRLFFSRGDLEITGELSCPSIAGGRVPGEETFSFDETTLKLDGDAADLATTFHLLDSETIAMRLIGPSTALRCSVDASSFSIEAESSQLELKGVGTVESWRYLTMTEPTLGQITLQPGLALGGPTLAAPTPARFCLSPFSLDLEEPDYSTLSFDFGLSMDEAVVLGSSATPIATVLDLEASASMDGPSNEICVGLSCQTSDGSVDLSCTVDGLLAGDKVRWRAAAANGAAAIDRFPLTLVDAILGHTYFTSLFGDELSLQATGQFTQLGHLKGELCASLESPLCTASADLLFADTLSLAQPARLDWQMTPEALQLLYGGHFALSTRAPITLSVEQLEWPWTTASRFPQQIGLTADLEIGRVSYGEMGDPSSYTLGGLSAHFSGADLAERLHYSISSQLIGETRGTMVMRGEVENLFRFDGGIERAAFSADGGIEIDHMPLRPLLTLIPLSDEVDQQLMALLGAQLSVTSLWNLERLNGPFIFRLDSSHSDLDLEGSFTAGRFFLTTPLTASLVVTPYLGQAVLGKINPLFATAVSSDRPIRLYVPDDEVQLPLYPFSAVDIQMPHFSLDLGRIALANQGAVSRLLSIFPGYLRSDPVVYAWFTPQMGSITDGNMRLERMDALIGPQLHIATWGTLNLANERADLNLGISGGSLKHLLDISNISDDYYIVIPMYGQMGSLSIDWFRATAQITALTARSMGGRAEQFGKILDVVSGSTHQRTKMPPQPDLPWEE